LYHDLVSMKRDGSNYYYLFDGLGSVTEVVDGSEATQNSYRYEAFGQMQSSTENITNPYRYVGAYGVHWDPSPALYFMQARYYAPDIGRFVSVDPVHGTLQDPMSLHRYLYARNNPVQWLDPSGLMSEDQQRTLNKVINCFAKCGYWFEYYAAEMFVIKAVRWLPFAAAWTNPVTGTVYIEDWLFDKPASLFATLAHEMQHIYDWFVCLRPFRTHRRPWRTDEQMIDDYYAHCG